MNNNLTVTIESGIAKLYVTNHIKPAGQQVSPGRGPDFTYSEFYSPSTESSKNKNFFNALMNNFNNDKSGSVV